MTPKLPTSKREKIIHLLDHWDDIHSPPVSGYGRSTGDDTAHLSPMSRHPSVIELTRCLHVLKLENKLWHDHLKAFHCAEWGVHTRTATRKRKGGKSETLIFRDRVRRPPAWVTKGYVTAAQFRLEELYVGPVFIPDPLWDALTLSSSEIEEKQRRRPRRMIAA